MTHLLTKVQKAWEEYICYPKMENVVMGSKPFFEIIERDRYIAHEYLKKILDQLALSQKKVLEIGVGVGTDASYLYRKSKQFIGIDLTQNALQFTKRRFHLWNLKGAFVQTNAEKLPFKDSSLDFVYSFGVLHHTPDTKSAIQEVHRILNEKGEAMIMLYYKNFCTYYLKLLFGRGILKGILFKKSKQELMNELEFEGCPLTKMYTKKMAKELFKDFSQISFKVDYLLKTSVPVLGRLFSQRFFDFFSPWFGFHLVIFVKK